MVRIRNTLGVVLLAVLLSSCAGLLSQVIPPQPVPNALGLDSEPATASKTAEQDLPEFATASVAPLQVVTEFFVATIPASFNDVDWEAVQAEAAPLTLPTPVRYSEELGINGTMTLLTEDTASAPASLTLAGFIINGVLSDDSDAAPVEVTFGQEGNAAVTFNRTSCVDNDSCAYAASNAEALASLVELLIQGQDFANTWTLLTNEVEPNQLEATVVLFVESAGTPGDSQISFTLATRNGTIAFR